MTLYGCHNRAPLKDISLVQIGWDVQQSTPLMRPVKHAIYAYIPDPMTKDCRYAQDEQNRRDPGCAGCRWR